MLTNWILTLKKAEILLWKRDIGWQVAKWLERWTCNHKVARSNPRADKVKICCSAREQGS